MCSIVTIETLERFISHNFTFRNNIWCLYSKFERFINGQKHGVVYFKLKNWNEGKIGPNSIFQDSKKFGINVMFGKKEIFYFQRFLKIVF